MLNPSTFVDRHSSKYLTQTELNPDGTPTGEYNFGTTLPEEFADDYDYYASQGIVLGAANHPGTANKAVLVNAIRSPSSLTPAGLPIFATAIATYWSTVAITPGTPKHGGTSVISVVNNAMTLVGDIQAAILSVSMSVLSEPWYFQLILAIESVIRSKCIWIVTEDISGTGPKPFPETIT
jgi:hypothetical protein